MSGSPITEIEPSLLATESVDPAVRVRGLHKRYGKFVAVADVDLDVPRGSVYAVIGPNGAGKTTTFAVLASLLKPTAGDVSVLGHDPASAAREVRRVVGYMPDSLGVYTDLDVDEYLRFFAASYKIASRTWDPLLDGLLELVGLNTKREARVDSLSRGMKQRLSLARALIHDPELLILDEPASGLDPRARSELRALLLQLSSMGKTIIISSHILSELEEVCSHIAIMASGTVRAAGTAAEVTGRLGGGRRMMARFDDGTNESFTVADEAEQALLLRRLVGEQNRTLVEFSRVGGGLEELFLSLTHDEELR